MWLIEHPTLNATNHRAAPRSGLASCCTSLRLFVFVRFVVFVLVVIVIVIVGVSLPRHRVAHDGDESPLGRGKVLRGALGHGRLLAGCRDIHALVMARGQSPSP